MTMKKILCLCMALILALGCFALAEEDLQAQLDAANAKIAELQALADSYYPYYAAQIVATYGTDGIIWLEDVEAEYEMLAQQYSSYGIDLAAYGMESYVKQDIVDTAVQDAVLLAKAKELGLDQLDPEAKAAAEAGARTALNDYLASYLDYHYSDAGEITEEMRAEAEAYWAENGVTYDSLYAIEHKAGVLTSVYEDVIKDVEVTDADVEAAYQALIEENKADYANDYNYNSDRDSGVVMAWQPEGYRAVKHVLIQFDEEQSALYSELSSQLDSLEAEKEAAENPAEPAEGEEAVQARSIEEIDADIAACSAELDALYAQLLPEAQAVIDAFNAGEDFDALIEKYNDDPGMQSEPNASIGYAVAESSTTWDPAFTQGAMSIENVGEISEVVNGSYGVHIIYYMEEIPGGEIALEEIYEDVKLKAADEKINTVYTSQVDAWMEEMNVEYFYENFGVTPE